MGRTVQSEGYFPGYISMRDLNDDSNSCSWPLFYGDKTLANGQYYSGFLPRFADAYPGYDKDAVKQTMLEHEAIFKNQLHELHRLYRRQRNLMDEIKRKELHKNQIAVETSLSSSPLASQVTSEDARKWHVPTFHLASSECAKPSTSRVEDIHSPLSSMKGSSAQASPLPSQNGGTSKDVEILESRPTKVRKKMFDLQLPADEYIDTEEGEQPRDEYASGSSSFMTNGNDKTLHASGINLFPENGGKKTCQGNTLQSESSLRSTNNVTDLNEPIKVEEANASACIDLLGEEPTTKSKSGFAKEISLNSHHGSNNVMLNNSLLQNNAIGKWWSPQMLGAGHSKNDLKSVSQGLQPEKFPASSQSMQVLFGKAHEAPSFFLTDKSKVDPLRDRTVCGLELSDRNSWVSSNSHPESVAGSNIPSSFPAAPSLDLSKSWSHSIPSWDKSSGTLSQKSILGQMHPYLNSSATMNRSSQTSTHSHVVLGDRWNYNSNCASNPSFEGQMSNQNGFYHGSSSGSKELLVRLPSSNYDYLNDKSSANNASEHLMYQGSVKLHKNSNCIDLKSSKDANLNIVLSNTSSAGAAPQQGRQVIDLERKHDHHLATLPWLRAKSVCKNEAPSGGIDLNDGELNFLQFSANQLPKKHETENGPNQLVIENMKSASSSNVVDTSRTEVVDSSSDRKILGITIFEHPHVSKKESSSFTSPSASEGAQNIRKNEVLDINLPCDLSSPDFGPAAEEVLAENIRDTKVANFRHQIDLNSCMSEDDTSLAPSALSSNLKKNFVGIDLEAPAPETDEDVVPGEACQQEAHEAPLQALQHKAEGPHNELMITAAEAIVAISLSIQCNNLDDIAPDPSEASMTDPLHWFADIVSSCREDLEIKLDAFSRAKDGDVNESSSSEEIDYFESMTLTLAETKEEDYMPKPLIPENLKLEETGTAPLPTRARRGQARRGRQRRDFQRDILPGLASLSRHEVTEDLQTFGGLMRATGHPWHSGLMRRNSTRNGCGRGRRRMQVSPSSAVTASPPCTLLIHQLNNIEVGLEDRSLTGWGKTTRRPRRQRCPAGNPPSVPLT